MSTESAKAIAEIAVTLTDKPIPTAAEILRALNLAYEKGLEHGLTFPAKPLEGFDYEY
jgi:hypothetical protein